MIWMMEVDGVAREWEEEKELRQEELLGWIHASSSARQQSIRALDMMHVWRICHHSKFTGAVRSDED